TSPDRPSTVNRSAARYVDRCVETGARSPRALRALLDVMSLEKRPTRLFSADMLWPMLLGKKLPLLGEAPLTADERDTVLR
ncbi:pyridine nucleotide-disulfide oxidoreductase, partial [Streptomyces sp. NPDC005534]